MSKVIIAGDASGTGTFTISAPNGNTDRTLVLPDEAGTVLTSAGVPASAMPAGSVIQVVSVAKTDTFSWSGQEVWTSITGLAATITPSSASSKILVQCVVMYGMQSTYNALGLAMARNGTRTPIGDSDGALRTEAFFGSDDLYGGGGANTGQATIAYLDSPSTTSATTYQLQGVNTRDGETIYINRPVFDPNDRQAYRGVSTITVMEIAG